MHHPRPMPYAMGRRPIADGVRATRCTGDGHREHATSPTKKNTHPTHLRASLPFVFSFFLGVRRERRRAAVHSARDPQSTPDSKSVHTGAPCDIFYALVAGLRALRRQCQHITTVMQTSRKKQRRWTWQHMIEIPAACAHCSCCNITFRRPESFCAKAAELEHTNMHRQRVHAHRLCLRTLLTTWHLPELGL